MLSRLKDRRTTLVEEVTNLSDDAVSVRAGSRQHIFGIAFI